MLSREYTIIMKHPESKQAIFVWKGKSLDDSYKWLESVSQKEKFQGLVPIRTSRLLFKGKPIQWHRAITWLNIILLIVLITKLATL